MTFSQFLNIIRARWLLVTAVFLVIVLVTLVVSLLIPKSYDATATVMVDVRPDPVSGLGAGSMQTATILATQVDIIKSPTVSRRVVQQLNLVNSPDLMQRWQKETKSKGDYVAWVAEVIGKGLDVKPSRESNVIDINYNGAEPAFAAALANAFAQAYIQSTVQIRVNPAKEYSDFFDERVKLAREKLEAAQNKLTAAQKEKGIVATEERLDVETQRLTDLSAQVTSLRALRADTSSRSAQAQTKAEQTPDVLNSSLIASLQADAVKLEGKLQELRQSYGDAHPTVIETQANLQAIKQRINSETHKVTSSLGIQNNIANSRESQALAAYEAQRDRVLKLKDARNELSILEREVESAQKIYDSLQARLSQTNLESNSSQSNIYLLAAATEPTKPASPKVTFNVALSALIGLLLALMAALAIEMFDHRIRSPQDIAQALDLPVIGILPSPQAKPKRFALIRSAHPLPKLERNSGHSEPNKDEPFAALT